MSIGRPPFIALLALTLLPCGGCGLSPHAFRKLQPSPATVRARQVGAGSRSADPQVIPALVNRLEDEDPVVRMAANAELLRRTGRDYGFVPWGTPEERTAAIARWRSYLTAPPMPAEAVNAPALPTLAAASSPARRPARRRRTRNQPPPGATGAVIPAATAPTAIPAISDPENPRP